ncbi:hypothetical protein BHU72_05415 [Desulfuribacillus stibiiarsenatis]|uniref:DNA topoisomerase n=1 Tax=Desulfuribacillus stibiiarsenatis TaxID=1390249 RepID=A0A1E5L4H4_9FIRM|nr:DNA topoisomerase III [Desulfuribacillus stibiiarsenatis]OEH85050.1 hypothetical protein BHU72_05415 [Desulfuribacillus stibiiarsenatis]
MGKTLIITEKPSVATDIGKVIGASSKKNGYLEGQQYLISWAVGHLVTLCEPEDYNERYKKWDVQTLPIIPEQMKLKPLSGTLKQYKTLEFLMNRTDIDDIICATDSGREGELIFRYIYDLVGCTKPCKRLWISSMTEEAIQEGFKQLKDNREYDNLYASAKCRSEADWLIGINGTRVYSVRNNMVYSVGRVQTPTLAMIVQRHHDITNFTPQDYWEIKSDYGDFSGTWTDVKENTSRITTESQALTIVNKVIGTIGNVKDVKKEHKKLTAPLLYNLTELQKDANKSFAYTAKQTLDIAQSLYEKHKLITYPRTDSRYLSDDMKSTISETLKRISVAEYRPYIEGIKQPIKFNNRIINNSKVTDHHAIIATPKVPNLDKLSQQERNIYDLIVRRFIAVFYPAYEYESTQIVIESVEECFLSKGTTVLKWGWKALYKNSNSSDDNNKDEQVLPVLKVGDSVPFVNAEMVKKQTQPPKPYNENTLLSAMENAGRFVEDEELREQLKDSGLGTPATRAAIIERLIQVEYIKREKKNLIPTEKGIKIISIIPNELKSPETTGKWERALNRMAKGDFSQERFMQSIHRFAHYLIQEAKKSQYIGEKKSNKRTCD